MDSYKYITTAGTYTFAGNDTTRVVLDAININKTTGGTVTIQAGSTVIGVIPAGSVAREAWMSFRGTEIESLTIVTVASEDITVFYRTV